MYKKIIYICIVAALTISLLATFVTKQFGISLGTMEWLCHWVSSPVALLLGIVFALTFGATFESFTKTMSKKMLQYSVIGLGFGMNVTAALASGKEGMLFTIVSVFGTLAIGWLIGRKLLKVDRETSYLISSGTAICGGSAIAAVGPVIKAKSESMSVALGVVFVLNAVALFVFPYIGDAIGMTMKQFGMWAAIAIHDTSSVVGAGSAYDAMHPELLASEGVSALEVATTIKLTRALWIVVLVLITPFLFRGGDAQKKAGTPWYQAVPRFIIWFVVAILVNTYLLTNAALIGEQAAHIGSTISGAVNLLAKQMITLSLFFIGAGLTRKTLRAVGVRPLIQGILLWITISCASLAYILWIPNKVAEEVTVTTTNMDLSQFTWTRSPKACVIKDGRIEITTNPHTDLWQRTYYHFRNDNAPVLQMETSEKFFSFIVRTDFSGSHTRFDQCGVVMYLDSENWLKGSVEYENAEFQHLGSVATNHGYSDWATTAIPADIKQMWYRLSRREDDFCIECSEDGKAWSQMRVCHMYEAQDTIRFGIYACSPEESSFTAVFTDMQLTECAWKAHDGQQPDEQ